MQADLHRAPDLQPRHPVLLLVRRSPFSVHLLTPRSPYSQKISGHKCAPICGPEQTYQEDGSCSCPTGFTVKGLKCVPKCKAPQHYDTGSSVSDSLTTDLTKLQRPAPVSALTRRRSAARDAPPRAVLSRRFLRDSALAPVEPPSAARSACRTALRDSTLRLRDPAFGTSLYCKETELTKRTATTPSRSSTTALAPTFPTAAPRDTPTSPVRPTCFRWNPELTANFLRLKLVQVCGRLPAQRREPLCA